MRPTGVVLIAVYHFIGAFLLILMAIGAVVGGSMLGAIFGGMNATPISGAGLGFAVGVLGAMFMLCSAVLAAAAGYGVWTMREWGRILCIVLAVLSLLFALPGLFFGFPFHFFFIGTYRLFRLAISIGIIWYLLQPHIRMLFRRSAPVVPSV